MFLDSVNGDVAAAYRCQQELYNSVPRAQTKYSATVR